MTRTVSALAPTKVVKLNRTLASAAQRRSPSTPRIAAPSRGGAPTSSRNSTSTILFQRLEILQIEVVELFANLEEEHAQHQHRDQDIERDAEFDHHRHPVGRAHGAEEQAIFHRQE